MRKILLLNASYEVLSFVSEKRAFKLLYKDKVDVISTWDEVVKLGKIQFLYPATLKLKNLIRRNYYYINFSRQAIVKRDRQVCQYCFKKLPMSEVTIDHVIPRCKGGISSFTNCVVSCFTCNSKKADRLLEEVGMNLAIKPMHPSFDGRFYLSNPPSFWHQDWDIFLQKSM
jgi:hypothetical protein